jgi:hypothetical protein
MAKDKEQNPDAGKAEEPSKAEPARTASSSNITEITGSLIDDLGGKLNEFSRSLTDDEQTVLATALALAGRGFDTFAGQQACVGNAMVGLGRNSISVERRAGAAPPELAGALEAAFCPGKAERFSIEGLEVDKTMYGAKSVAAGYCRTPGLAAAKSVAAAACRTGLAGSKSVAAACRTQGLGAAKSVAAAAAKSVAAAACRTGFAGSKSVAANAACRTGFAGSKSVAAASKSVAASACRFQGLAGSKSVAAACRNTGYGTQYMSGAFCRG